MINNTVVDTFSDNMNITDIKYLRYEDLSKAYIGMKRLLLIMVNSVLIVLISEYKVRSECMKSESVFTKTLIFNKIVSLVWLGFKAYQPP